MEGRFSPALGPRQKQIKTLASLINNKSNSQNQSILFYFLLHTLSFLQNCCVLEKGQGDKDEAVWDKLDTVNTQVGLNDVSVIAYFSYNI